MVEKQVLMTPTYVYVNFQLQLYISYKPPFFSVSIAYTHFLIPTDAYQSSVGIWLINYVVQSVVPSCTN